MACVCFGAGGTPRPLRKRTPVHVLGTLAPNQRAVSASRSVHRGREAVPPGVETGRTAGRGRALPWPPAAALRVLSSHGPLPERLSVHHRLLRGSSGTRTSDGRVLRPRGRVQRGAGASAELRRQVCGRRRSRGPDWPELSPPSTGPAQPPPADLGPRGTSGTPPTSGDQLRAGFRSEPLNSPAFSPDRRALSLRESDGLGLTLRLPPREAPEKNNPPSALNT